MKFVIHRIFNGALLEQLNDDQHKAVTNILFSSTNHLPHLLIGPPGKFTVRSILIQNFMSKSPNLFSLYRFQGTGKTQTLLALVEQIVRTTKQNVLFCAPTNDACDEITMQLIRVLNTGELYRFYATSNKFIKSKQQILEVSNFTGTAVYYPPLDTLYKYRVVICTIENAGFLTRARINADWNGQNFKYVIIDDCATVHETMTFIPIAGNMPLTLWFAPTLFDFVRHVNFRFMYVKQENPLKNRTFR